MNQRMNRHVVNFIFNFIIFFYGRLFLKDRDAPTPAKVNRSITLEWEEW
jgi:hypothetical protein